MNDQAGGGGGAWNTGELQRAFAGIGEVATVPLGLEEIEGAGVGLTFYVGWAGAAPSTYSAVRQAVEQFHRQMQWSIRPEFNNRGAFISVLPLTQARRSFEGQDAGRVSLANLDEEVRSFCAHIADSFQHGPLFPSYRADVGINREVFEDSEYSIFLVAKPQQFSGSPTSTVDFALHYGITHDEWLVLSREAEDKLGPTSSSLRAAFMMKLKQRYEVIRLSASDVVSLSTELGESISTSQGEWEMAILKLQRILSEASSKDLGLVFEPND